MDEELEVNGSIDLSNYEVGETSLVGYVRSHTHMHMADNTEFSKKLEALMEEYKVVKVDVCFDPFKMNKSDEGTD